MQIDYAVAVLNVSDAVTAATNGYEAFMGSSIYVYNVTVETYFDYLTL